MTQLTQALSERETVQRWAAGELLFREGEEPRGVYILHSGKVDLLFSGKRRGAKPLRIAESPQILGVSELVSGTQHDCSATTRTSCLIGYVEKAQFLDILNGDPESRFSILQALSEDINSCYASMRVLSTAR